MKKITQALVLTSTVLANSAIAHAADATDRYFYIGGELGISEPLIKAFEHKESARLPPGKPPRSMLEPAA
jgi:hypothetical protein